MKRNIGIYFAVLFFSIFAANGNVYAAKEKTFLTVDKLVTNGYEALSGEEILKLMDTKKIQVIDIETDAVTVSHQENSAAAIDRRFETTKADKAASMLDARLLARAPALEGKVERRVEGDELIATDGVRTYHYRLYKKQEVIYAVRDIDNGNVFFKVEVK